MTQRMRLSERTVSRLRVEKVEYTVWDTRTPGLGVRVRTSGHKAFVILAGQDGSSKRRSLGSVTLMDVDEARNRCLAMQSGVENQAPTIAAALLFRDFVRYVWKAECYDRYKSSTRGGYDSLLKSQLLAVFGDVPLDRIERQTVNRWFDRYSTTAPGNANHALDLLGQIINHAKVHGHVGTNPVSGIRRNPRRKLNRFLSQDEIIRLHAELDCCVAERPSRAVQADIIRLLFFTGCRCGEIRNLKWEEVGDRTLNLADSKTGPRRVYLNSEARAIIERQPHTGNSYVFPSPHDPSRPLSETLSLWYRVRKRAEIEDVRLHDLRHNFASWAVMRGVPIPTVARLLGHRQVSMTLRYAHVHDNEVEAAAERIGRIIVNICGPSGS